MSQTVLITGANRGLGLGLVKVYLKRGDKVLAACRQPDQAKELHDLAREHSRDLSIIQMDVSSDESCRRAAAAAAGESPLVDIIVNNAAIGNVTDGSLEGLDLSATLNLLNINTLGPARVTREFLPLLRKSKNARVANISSGLGCISAVASCESLAYGTSKAGLNYISRSMAWDLKKDGITMAAISPGWVRTDMGGKNAALTPEQSAGGIAKVIDSLRPEDIASWFDWDGKKNDRW